jgi:hypothetical protein
VPNPRPHRTRLLLHGPDRPQPPSQNHHPARPSTTVPIAGSTL